MIFIYSMDITKLTSVKIFEELYEKFKEEGSEMTLQKLVNISMDFYLKDKKYKILITEH